MTKRQQPKKQCMACRKRPATQRFVDSSGIADVCGYCLRKLQTEARKDLRILEAAAIVIEPDAWLNADKEYDNAMDSTGL